jgi:hypothetical protein
MAELVDANKDLGFDLDTHKIKERFSVCGGVFRACLILSNYDFKRLKDAMIRECSKLDQWVNLMGYMNGYNHRCYSLLLCDAIAGGKKFGNYRTVFASKFFENIILEKLWPRSIAILPLEKFLISSVTRQGYFFLYVLKDVIKRKLKDWGSVFSLGQSVNTTHQVPDNIHISRMDAPFIGHGRGESRNRIYLFICTFIDNRVSRQRIQNILLAKRYYGIIEVQIFCLSPSDDAYKIAVFYDVSEQARIFNHLVPQEIEEIIFEYLFDLNIEYIPFAINSKSLSKTCRLIQKFITRV